MDEEFFYSVSGKKRKCLKIFVYINYSVDFCELLGVLLLRLNRWVMMDVKNHERKGQDYRKRIMGRDFLFGSFPY